MGDEQLIARVIDELNVLPARSLRRTTPLVQRWPNALPQYYVGHETIVFRCRAAAAPLGVALCGNAYDGVGIPASMRSGRRAGREALEMLHFSYPLNESEVVAGVDVDAGHTFADVHRVVLRIVVEGQTNVETRSRARAARRALNSSTPE